MAVWADLLSSACVFSWVSAMYQSRDLTCRTELHTLDIFTITIDLNHLQH
jgi:hypothetical protein